MSDVKAAFRGSIIGHFIYSSFRGRVLKYKEDHSEYTPDEKYLLLDLLIPEDKDSSTGTTTPTTFPKIQVTFDGPDDPENPQNWPLWLKVIIGLTTSTLNFVVYVTAIIVTPAQSMIKEEFGVSDVVSVLPITLFVYGYGIGPMIFSPLSEHPKYGRNIFYATTLLLFVIFQIPCVFVKNFAGLCVLRFISGFFISPVLATGGASFVDVVSPPYAPQAMSFWGLGSYAGIAVGPLLGASFMQATNGWRWDFWFTMIMAAVMCLIFCIIPETYNLTVLYRKAERLGRITGNPNLSVYSEGQSESTTFSIKEILWRPIVIGFTEPVVLLINLYIPLVYGVTFLWLEGFPIVFTDAHHFGLITAQLPYISIVVGTVIGIFLYSGMLYKPYTLALKSGNELHPEVFMPASIIGSLFLPPAMFIFGWTSSPDINWFPPIIGGVLFGIAGIILFQTLLSYIAMSFPRYVASAFAGNSLARAFIAGSFPLFGKRLFLNLPNKRFPVGYGSTILGCIALLMVSIPILFYLNGKKLRAHSKYAGKT